MFIKLIFGNYCLTQLHNTTNKQMSLIDKQETNLTISEFVSLGSNIDYDILGNQKIFDASKDKHELNIAFDSRAKRIIQHLCFYQNGDQLCGRDRAYLDNSTVPCHIMKFSIDALIYTLLRTNIKTSEILKIIFIKNWGRLLFFTFILLISSPLLQEILNPKIGLLTAIIFQIIFIVGSLIGPIIAFISPGYFYKRISKDFIPSYIPLEKQTIGEKALRDYFVKHYEDLRKFMRSSSPDAQRPNKSGFIAKIIFRTNAWLRQQFTKNGILLSTKDVENWIEIATGSKVQALINEGENIKTISAKEYFEKKLAEAKNEFDAILTEKQKHINGLIERLTLERKTRKEFQDKLTQKELENQKLQKSSKLTADALEHCPTIINSSMPNITVGKVVNALRQKNKNISKISIVQFMTALDMESEYPLKSENHEVKNISEAFENATLRTWSMLFPNDISAINAYEDNLKDKSKNANFSMKNIAYYLFVDDPRSTNENPDHPRNCDFETLLSLRCPKRKQ